jgi:hypothetical protein
MARQLGGIKPSVGKAFQGFRRAVQITSQAQG